MLWLLPELIVTFTEVKNLFVTLKTFLSLLFFPLNVSFFFFTLWVHFPKDLKSCAPHEVSNPKDAFTVARGITV